MNLPLSAVRLFRFSSVAALWISFMAVFWIVLLSRLAGQPYDPIASVILCLVTWAIYAADHAGGSAEDLMSNPGRAWLAKYPVKKLAALAYLLALIIVAWWDVSKLPCGSSRIAARSWAGRGRCAGRAGWPGRPHARGGRRPGWWLRLRSRWLVSLAGLELQVMRGCGLDGVAGWNIV
ncbi:MAG: hypothetical protein WBN94_04205 [Methanothrix sp.]